MIAPIVEPDSTIRQILVDLKTMETLKWKSYVLMYDSSITEDVSASIVAQLRKSASLTIFNLEEKPAAELFPDITLKNLGNKVLFVVKKDMVADIISEIHKNKLSQHLQCFCSEIARRDMINITRGEKGLSKLNLVKYTHDTEGNLKVP